MQSRKRELQAKNTVQKLNKEFANRERVLKGQLEQKEREVKRQRELIAKKENVKAIRDAAPSKRFSGLGSSSLGLPARGDTIGTSSSNEFSLTSQRIAALDMWLSQELDAQKKRNCLHDEIEGMMESRAKLSRKLHGLKSQRGTAESSTYNSFGFSRESEVKQLEEEVRSKSISLAKHQGMLADLGTVVEKRRFAGFSDHKETKYIMHWLFQKLSKELPLSQRASDAKISAKEDQIDVMKKQILSLESNIQELHTQVSIGSVLDTSSGSVSTVAEEANTTIRKRSGSSMSSAGGLDSMEECNICEDTSKLQNPTTLGKGAQRKNTSTSADVRSKIMMTAKSVNTAIRETTGALKGTILSQENHNAPAVHEDIDDMSRIADPDETFDDISSVEDPMDESFRPEEDDDESDDEEHHSRKRVTKKKRSSPAESSSERSSSVSSNLSGRKRSIGDIIEAKCQDDIDEGPKPKRSSPFRESSSCHRRRSIGGTPTQAIIPGRQSLATGIAKQARPTGTKKLRRASLAGTSDLEFVHEDNCQTEKENQSNTSDTKNLLLPPNIETYTIRDLKDLLSRRGLSQTGLYICQIC